ncbi:DUF4383 domain-containing protein [Magnetospirillum sp. UT-4]|uniref:DUF4383 domain-containing protein n=1 Tax=Magnetospirillum sp. UT-4 TaxID=2681467 RepID=UPI00137E5C56|nr:DUF4383 domain-containing protein [Magnetospirillum sp. UT-4]CAA7619415.1 conserved membrane hypothetical protein [Magnetospirillum sp. UT-4]
MKTRYFALVMGVVFLAIGILGFVPGVLMPPEAGPPLVVEAGHGVLFGLFPVNVLHNIVHLAFGVWGVVVWRSFVPSRAYARAVAVVYAVLTVMGLIPVLDTVFGLVPIHSHDIWLHGAITLVAAYFGYAPVTAVETAGDLPPRR